MNAQGRIVVVGGGTMGNGIAHTFALSGYPVTLIEVDEGRLDAALTTIRGNMERQVAKATITATDRDAALVRITPSTDVAAAPDATLAVEAVVEQAGVKERVFRTLDQALQRDAILASNTSSIPITRLASVTTRPEKVIGMHFMNPVPMMKLVEVIRGVATSDETCETVLEIARSLGKTPVEVNDAPGFISNRVLMPMINEAVFALHEGVATPEAIDTVMKLGMNHPMGPLSLADLIGLDVCLDILQVLYDGFGDPKYRPCPLLRQKVMAGHLGRKTGRGFYTYTDGAARK
jgi:3-hydroxybutyryl-CoA dehydrogenase